MATGRLRLAHKVSSTLPTNGEIELMTGLHHHWCWIVGPLTQLQANQVQS